MRLKTMKFRKFLKTSFLNWFKPDSVIFKDGLFPGLNIILMC